MLLTILLLFNALFLFILLIRQMFKSPKYQGEMTVIKHDDGRLTYSLEFDENPDGFQYMQEVRFRVIHEVSAE